MFVRGVPMAHFAQRGCAATEGLKDFGKTADYADGADIRNLDFQSVRPAWKAFAR